MFKDGAGMLAPELIVTGWLFMANTKLMSFAVGFVLLVAATLSYAADGPEKPDATGEKPERPTAEQLAAIDTIQHVPPTSIEGRDLLQAAMMRKENEPLAEHLVQLTLKDAPRSNDFIVMIANRAATSLRHDFGRAQFPNDRIQLRGPTTRCRRRHASSRPPIRQSTCSAKMHRVTTDSRCDC
jgi:hypothetical protein